MSKKKVMPRSTMTLKDFHGGSIPSDLQLPSAPGMTVDRSSYERHGSNVWSNNSINRGYGGDRGGYHRQGPLNGIRPFEDKASYFPNTANIGRNYDEDERRPVDYRPRSSPSQEEYRSSSADTGGRQGSYADPRATDRYPREYDNGASYRGQLSRSPDRLQYSYQTVGRFGPQQPSVSAPRTPPEPPSNVWAARREGDQGRGRSAEPDVPAGSPWRVRNNMARIAEASAIDKVSSGRWQPGFTTNLERRNSEPEKFTSRKEGPYEVDTWKVETLHITHGIDQEYDSRKDQFDKHNMWKAQGAPEPGYRLDHDGVRSSYNDSGKETFSRMVPSAMHGHEGTDARFTSSGYDYADRSDSYRRGNADSYPEDRYRGFGREDHNYSVRASYDRLEVHGDGGSRYSGIDAHGHYVSQPDYRNAPGSRQPQFDREYIGQADNSKRSDYRPSFIQESNYPPSSHVSTHSDSGRTGTALNRSNSGERPKLNLKPRTKPVDEAPEDYNELDRLEDTRARHQQAGDREAYESQDAAHDGYRGPERPKLSLKPRTYVAEDVVVSGKERQSLFGGARPRELVLKERGADDAIITGIEVATTPASSDVSRIDSEVRAEKKDRWQEGRHFDRNDSRTFERQGSSGIRKQDNGGERQESGKLVNRREQDLVRSESDRYDSRRDFGRQDRRDHQDVKRDIDKQESWRRPADPPSPAVNSALAEIPSRASAKSYGSSALQLAQVFSRSASISRTTVSRLTDTSSPRYNNNNNSNNSNSMNKRDTAALQRKQNGIW